MFIFLSHWSPNICINNIWVIDCIFRVIENIQTGNDIDGRDSFSGRFSLDYDVDDKTSIELTYDYQKADDNRQNIGINYCLQDPLFGCSPFEVGLSLFAIPFSVI